MASEGKAEGGRARERVSAAAADLFYRKGIHAVGVEEIVRQAGVAKISLYRSFASKDDLVVAYLEERSESFLKAWDDAFDRYREAPREQVRAIMTDVATGQRRTAIGAATSSTSARSSPIRSIRAVGWRPRRSRRSGIVSSAWLRRSARRIPRSWRTPGFCSSKAPMRSARRWVLRRGRRGARSSGPARRWPRRSSMGRRGNPTERRRAWRYRHARRRLYPVKSPCAGLPN